MGMLAQINDQNELQVTMTASGQYNPDIIEDLKRRLLDAYKEALQTQVEISGGVYTTPVFIEQQEEEGESE